MAGLPEIQAVPVDTGAWTMRVLSVAPKMARVDRQTQEQKRNAAGQLAWQVILLVEGATDDGAPAQLGITTYGSEPDLSPLAEARFVGDRAVARPWGTDRRSGLWWEIEGIEEVA